MIATIEKVEPMRSFQTEKGMTTSQTIVVRALEGTHPSTDRYAVECYTGMDLTQFVGKCVFLHIHCKVTERDGRNYNNLYTREVALTNIL